MEVSQTATAGPHYSKRWDATASERDSYYPGESWKESSGRKIGSTGTGVRPWTDGIGAPPFSTTPASARSVLFSDGTIDKVLYQNLVEMIPLVETLMDQHNNKSFPRHASLIYTPTPSRDPLMLKKAVEQKGKRGHNQFFRGRRGELKDGFFWGNADSVYLDSRETHPEEIPMLSFPTDHQVDQNALNKDTIARLQGQIEQLEQKLEEKDNQLQAAETSTHQQDDFVRLQASIEELKERIASKEQEVQQALNQLSEKQHEVASLQSLLQKAQAGLEASNSNVTKVQAELDNLQCQVASFILEMQRISLNFGHDAADPEHGLSSASSPWSKEDGRMNASPIPKSDGDVELTRQLRAQLQNFLMQPDTIPGPIHDICGVQSGNYALK
ncbi:hypothetical protein GOP47_0009770 [Adiantum capillus-veneris]|uniref:Uncharacterized protein n=1 Tax=Adiantum capillus-veneris TaxID=13818 RepID=A0A9D4UX84_ADICA|nr:hypothetical protein GOP47_0009770 [Adiantum capillus-veneris]